MQLEGLEVIAFTLRLQRKKYSHFHIKKSIPNNLRDLCVCTHAHTEEKNIHRVAALLYQFSGLFFLMF